LRIGFRQFVVDVERLACAESTVADASPLGAAATPTTSAPQPGHDMVLKSVAQLLLRRNQILVCSYVPRTAGTFS
jgi:hypothetical protein